MSSMAGAAGERWGRAETTVARRLAVSLVLALLAMFVALAIWFAIRRVSGALTQPLSGGALIGLALGLSAIAAGIRVAGRSLTSQSLSTQYSVLSTQYPLMTAALLMIPGLSAAVTLMALTIPGSSPL